MEKKILFRVDASARIGSGHVMRCLTLADALSMHSAKCVFACASLPASMVYRIEGAGHGVVMLPEVKPISGAAIEAIWDDTEQLRDSGNFIEAFRNDAVDWVIVDHYGLDRRWESAIRTSVRRMMVIDDLANRSHDCDLLLDQNLGRKSDDYEHLVQPSTKILAGPRYALLRPEFAAARSTALARREHSTSLRLLISLGGSDPQNTTSKILKILNNMALPKDTEITVVLGGIANTVDEVRERARAMRYSTEVLVDVREIATLMSRCDLAIGAAGATAWERCCLGLPSIVLVLAENQIPGAQALVTRGAATTILLESLPSFDFEAFFDRASGVSPASAMSEAAAGICDGLGVERVSGVLNG